MFQAGQLTLPEVRMRPYLRGPLAVRGVPRRVVPRDPCAAVEDGAQTGREPPRRRVVEAPAAPAELVHGDGLAPVVRIAFDVRLDDVEPPDGRVRGRPPLPRLEHALAVISHVRRRVLHPTSIVSNGSKAFLSGTLLSPRPNIFL